MKVHLINPPASGGVDMVREGRCMQRAGAWTAVWAPISLATIAAVLEQENIECVLDDCIIESIDEETILTKSAAIKPDAVILNTATPSINDDLKLASDLKKKLPTTKIIAIGIHVSALPEESLEMSKGLDAVIIGEPELTAKDIILAIKNNGPISNIPGTCLKDKDKFIYGPERELADLNELPYPAWHLVKRHLYTMPFTGKPFLLIGTSRGCPFHCRFCADPTYYGHKLRTKSPQRIVDELRHVNETFGINDFLFWSESFTLKREWTSEVLDKIIDADFDIKFVVNSRTDHVDPWLLGLLKKAGCWMIGYGLEGGSQKILDKMNKKTTVEQNRNAVEWAREARLQVTAHMVFGYPGETLKTMQETLDFACSLPLDFAQFYCAVPFPGSEFHKEALENRWITENTWEKFEQNFCIVSTPQLSAREIMEFRSKAYRKFYSDPSRVFRVLTKNVGITGLPRLLKMFFSFRGWV